MYDMCDRSILQLAMSLRSLFSRSKKSSVSTTATYYDHRWASPPKDILAMILFQLDIRSIASSSRVCKNWHAICTDETLWKQLCRKHNWDTKYISEKLWVIKGNRILRSHWWLRKDHGADLFGRYGKIEYYLKCRTFHLTIFHRICSIVHILEILFQLMILK